MYALPSEHFDQKRLAQLQSLQGDLFFELMTLFVQMTPQHVSDIEFALECESADTLWRSAHALKSSSLNIGAEVLARLCHKVELLGKSGELLQAAPLIADLKEEYDKITAIFQSQLKIAE